MKIDETIFNEIQEVPTDPIANEYFTTEIMPEIIKKEKNYISKKPHETEISFYKIPIQSLLYQALLIYYHDRTNMFDHVRDIVEDDDDIYFASKSFGDWIAADLLDGDSDPNDTTRELFLDTINEAN